MVGSRGVPEAVDLLTYPRVVTSRIFGIRTAWFGYALVPTVAVACVVALAPAAPALVVAAPSIPPVGASAVLSPVAVDGTTAPPASPAAVTAAVAPVLNAGSWEAVSAVVLDPSDGSLLYESSSIARTPASTLKIPTALTVLSVLGPDTRLRTRVVLDGSTVVIIGAGDATLGRAKGVIDGVPTASLNQLAQLTAKALDKQGVASVHVAFDDSLFTGPTLSPEWNSALVTSGAIAPVTALSADQGRESATSDTSVSDPAASAARYFAAQLRDAGIDVARGVQRVAAPTDAPEIAHVLSPTIAEITDYTLTESDNDVAEALAHLAGGKLVGEASFAGGARAMKQVLEAYGIPTEGMKVSDGSGLARSDRMQAITLARTLQVIVTGRAPEGIDVPSSVGWAVSVGLPVAGFTGTLANRFDNTATRAGRGVVRAKTGTLTGISALAGQSRDRDGRLLVFVALASGIPDIDAARGDLDEFAATVAACGCR